jgi:glycosyltransferase involved in cell wall biosynthesis
MIKQMQNGTDMQRSTARVSVIIITLNEQENIEQCLTSIAGWSDDIHIVDSHSTDNTVLIARHFRCNIHKVEPGHWANIRQWALSHLPLKYEWIAFIDADEWLTPELKNEITEKIGSNTRKNGFSAHLRLVFLNRQLKYGERYFRKLVLLRSGTVRYVSDGDAEHRFIKGQIGELRNDLMHQDLKPFAVWVDKHNRISLRAAQRYLEEKKLPDEAVTNRRNLRKLWDKLPLGLRPFFMFFYVYILRLGFLDGVEGLIYYLHHAFWYELLVYTKVKEIESAGKKR